MATDYEKQWPKLRIEWAEEKIGEWQRELQKVELPLLARRKLESDIRNMTMALSKWKRGDD